MRREPGEPFASDERSPRREWPGTGPAEPAAGVALALGAGLLVLATAFVQGGSSPAGLALGVGGALLALGAGAVLVVARLAPAPRATATGWTAVAALGLWAAVAFSSMTWSLSPSLSWLDAVRTLAAVAALVGGIWLGNLLLRPGAAACLTLVGVAGCVLSWSLVDRSFERFVSAQTSPRLSAPFGYANALAALGALAAPAALWLAVHDGRRERAAGGAVLGLLTVALPLTGSRGGLLAAIAGLALWFLLSSVRLHSAAALAGAVAGALPGALWALSLPTFNAAGVLFPEPAGVGLPLVAAGSMALAAGLAVALQELADRLSEQESARAGRLVGLATAACVALLIVGFAASRGGPVAAVEDVWDGFAGSGEVGQGVSERLTETGSNLRGRWWGEAWEAFASEPLHGVGAGTFGIVDQLLRPVVPDTPPVIAREPHSLPLHVLSGLGLAGALPAAVAFVAGGLAAVAGVRRLRRDDRLAGIAVLAGLAAVAFHNLLDWDWSFSALGLLTYGGAGLLAGAGLRGSRPDGAVRLRAGLALPAAAAALLCALLPWLGGLALDRAERLEAAEQRDAALVQAELATALQPVSTEAHLRRARLLQQVGRERDARSAVRRALELEPLSWEVWAAAGEFQVTCWDERERGLRSLRYAVRLSGGLRSASDRLARPRAICAPPS